MASYPPSGGSAPTSYITHQERYLSLPRVCIQIRRHSHPKISSNFELTTTFVKSPKSEKTSRFQFSYVQRLGSDRSSAKSVCLLEGCHHCSCRYTQDFLDILHCAPPWLRFFDSVVCTYLLFHRHFSCLN